MRSPRSGRSSRAPISGAQPQPSRCSVAFDVHAPFALAPVRIAEHREQPRRNPLQRRRRIGFARRRLEPKRAAQSRRGRHREARRMNEGEQLEQVEPAKLGIAEPLPDQRRVEDDVRSFRRASDRFAAARLAHLPIAVRQPDPGMGRVKRGKGQAVHRPHLKQRGTEVERGLVG